MFRLTPSSVPVAVVRAAGVPADGLPASAGRATGIVCLEPDDVLPDAQSVLVVETLDPDLASALPTLAALVAETGSVLSHLAILAREMHVPTVVALDGARSRFPAGSHVLVDGGTGEVRVVTTGERS
jgi:pyruvate,water dikinase